MRSESPCSALLRRAVTRLALGLSLLFALAPNSADAQNADEKAIRSAIESQTAAWNRGDIPGFMQAYEESSETTFIGQSIGKGFEHILERYRRNYSTHEQMGELSFNHLEVRLLRGSCGKDEFAIVTGQFHLERTQKGEAKKDDGIFSLVWRKGQHGWKIVLDHTS